MSSGGTFGSLERTDRIKIRNTLEKSKSGKKET